MVHCALRPRMLTLNATLPRSPCPTALARTGNGCMPRRGCACLGSSQGQSQKVLNPGLTSPGWKDPIANQTLGLSQARRRSRPRPAASTPLPHPPLQPGNRARGGGLCPWGKFYPPLPEAPCAPGCAPPGRWVCLRALPRWEQHSWEGGTAPARPGSPISKVDSQDRLSSQKGILGRLEPSHGWDQAAFFPLEHDVCETLFAASVVNLREKWKPEPYKPGDCLWGPETVSPVRGQITVRRRSHIKVTVHIVQQMRSEPPTPYRTEKRGVYPHLLRSYLVAP